MLVKVMGNAHAVRGRLTLKDVKERHFRIESFSELQSSKETQKNTNKPQTNSNNETTNSLVMDAMLEFKLSKTNWLLRWLLRMISLFCIAAICNLVLSSFISDILLVYGLFLIAVLCIAIYRLYNFTPFCTTVEPSVYVIR